MTEQAKKPQCGVIYVATGAKFVAEAEKSLATLRKTNPDLPAMLLTDSAPANPERWDTLSVDASLKGVRGASKLYMDRAPWERCLFLDTDTHVYSDLSQGFTLLDRFDLAGDHYHSGHHYQLPGLPSSFPEICSGVLFWKKNERTSVFFDLWREFYHGDPETYGGRKWDQKSLRYAVWLSDVRFIDLPSSYDLITYFPAVIEGPVVIAHGRSAINLDRMKQRMSSSEQLRAYVPGIGMMRHPSDMSLFESLWVIWRITAWKLKKIFQG